MQIRTEEMKKMVNDRSLKRTKASAPRIWAKVAFVPLAFGGVGGNKKLHTPSTSDAIAAILKVRASWSVVMFNTLSIIQPVAIHPMVPKTRIDGNSLLGSCICLKATAFASARVGA